jgi:hypothetical protein
MLTQLGATPSPTGGFTGLNNPYIIGQQQQQQTLMQSLYNTGSTTTANPSSSSTSSSVTNSANSFIPPGSTSRILHPIPSSSYPVSPSCSSSSNTPTLALASGSPIPTFSPFAPTIPTPPIITGGGTTTHQQVTLIGHPHSHMFASPIELYQSSGGVGGSGGGSGSGGNIGGGGTVLNTTTPPIMQSYMSALPASPSTASPSYLAVSHKVHSSVPSPALPTILQSGSSLTTGTHSFD